MDMSPIKNTRNISGIIFDSIFKNLRTFLVQMIRYSVDPLELILHAFDQSQLDNLAD